MSPNSNCPDVARHQASASKLRSIAITLWIGLLVVCSVRAIIQPYKHSVYPIYMYAADEWLAGRDTYVLVPGYDFHRYSPTMTACFAAMRPLGDRVGGAVWRVLGAAILASGLLAFGRHALPRPLSTWQMALLFLIVWPLLLQNANNGQANPHLIGLLLWGMADVARGRFWRSAIWFTCAVLIKPYVIALVGLVMLIEPRLAIRFFAALAVGMALPFVLHSPSYVARQYSEWLHHFKGNDRSGQAVRNHYRDLLLLLRMYFVPISHSSYMLLELIAGLALAGVVLAAKRAGLATRQLLLQAFALGSCWITVLGPATESCTYVLLAPAAGVTVLNRPGRSGRWARVACGLLIAVVAASMFPQDWSVQVLGPQPLAGLIILGLTLSEVVRAMRKTTANIPQRLAA